MYRDIQGIHCLLYDSGKHGYTGHIGVYRVYSMTRVNTGYIEVYRVYSLTRVNIGAKDI